MIEKKDRPKSNRAKANMNQKCDQQIRRIIDNVTIQIKIYISIQMFTMCTMHWSSIESVRATGYYRWYVHTKRQTRSSNAFFEWLLQIETFAFLPTLYFAFISFYSFPFPSILHLYFIFIFFMFSFGCCLLLLFFFFFCCCLSFISSCCMYFCFSWPRHGLGHFIFILHKCCLKKIFFDVPSLSVCVQI